MKKNKTGPETPRPDAFRAWLRSALLEADLKPATAAKAIGASVNSVGAFLRDPARDITLGRAAELERYVRGVAQKAGIELPAIRRKISAHEVS